MYFTIFWSFKRKKTALELMLKIRVLKIKIKSIGDFFLMLVAIFELKSLK
jgi:hypothetical protein